MDRTYLWLGLGLLALALLLAACNSNSAAAPVGTPDVEKGKALFAASNGGCVACHTTKDYPNGGKSGPDLSNIGATAGSKKAGQDAATFIRNGIVNPSDYVEPGYFDYVMPRGYQSSLGDARINDLVGYLLTQK